MKRTIPTLAVLVALAAALATAAPASAAFGYKDFDVAFTEADGSTAAQAGSHPFAMSTSFEVNSRKRRRNRARANIRGQNGRLSRARPRVVALRCAKRRGARGLAAGVSRASALG